MKNKQTITIEVEDKPGVLTRISSLFSRRGYNIQSMTVGATDLPGISRFTIVALENEKILEQIRKQSQKLIHVLKTEKLDPENAVNREFALIKIRYNENSSEEINEIIDLYGATMLDLTEEIMILEFSGSEQKIDQIFSKLKTSLIIEVLRTGIVASL